MHAIVAYIVVIAIWSTTPLAISLSNDSVSPIAAVSMRMCLALLVGVLIAFIFGRGRYLLFRNWHLYLAASISIFPNMPLVYYASEYISSGLVAVLFGLTPLFTGIASALLLNEKLLNSRRSLACIVALSGLVTICADQIGVNVNAAVGIALMLVSNMLFSLSSVLVKRFSQQNAINPLDQTLGALAFALPGLLLTWSIVDADTPLLISDTSASAIVYLALFGSLMSFVAFFIVLERLGMAYVAVIPLMTPMLALWLGASIMGETVSPSVKLGSGLIIFALLLYEGRIAQVFLRYLHLLNQQLRGA